MLAMMWPWPYLQRTWYLLGTPVRAAHALPGTHKGGVDGGWDRPDGQMFPMHRWPHWLSHYVDCGGGAEDNPGWKAKTGWLWGVYQTEAAWCVLKPTSIQRTSKDWGRKRESNSRARFSSLLVSSDLESIKVVITCGDQRIVNDVLSQILNEYN